MEDLAYHSCIRYDHVRFADDQIAHEPFDPAVELDVIRVIVVAFG